MLARLSNAFVRVIWISAAGSLLPAPSWSQSAAPQNAGAAHVMGKELTVYNYPLEYPIVKHIAVHTYPVALANDGKRWAWKALGGDSGGSVLADTTTQCSKDCIDISTVNYVMSEKPCIWPYDPYYAVVGVCWNATNRGLYYTGKTVHEVRFYTVIEILYGTYGLDTNSKCIRKKCREGRELFAWSRCMKSAKEEYPWQGRAVSELAAGAGAVDPRIRLFQRYFGDEPDRELADMKSEPRQAQYMTDLFDLNMDQKLGPDFSAAKRDRLHAIRERLFDAISELEIPEDDHGRYLMDINETVNAALKAFAQILRDDEYLRLLNASKDEAFDIRII